MTQEQTPFERAVQSRGSGAQGLPQSEWITNGQYPVIGQGADFIEGWTNRTDLLIRPSPSLVLYGGHTRRAKYVDFPFVLGPNVKVLEAKDKSALDHRYLFYFLSGLRVKSRGYADHFPEVKRTSIPLPPIDDQIRIAHLLGKVEGLIAQRKQHLQHLDELLKSVFLEMFGDPVRNEKGWDTKTLPQLVLPGKNSLKRGPFGGALKKEIFVETGYLVYEQNHALNNDYSFARYFVNDEKYQELIDFKVVPGDVLISCSGIYLGKLSIVPANSRPGIINQALLKVSLDPQKIEHRFFVHVFGNPQFKEKYFPSNRGGAIPNLPPMSVMKEIPFIHPPQKLQQEFTNIYEKVDVLKSEYHQSLNDLESLYGILSQQAFKGELDLSRVPLPKDESHENDQSLNMQKNRLGVR